MEGMLLQIKRDLRAKFKLSHPRSSCVSGGRGRDVGLADLGETQKGTKKSIRQQKSSSSCTQCVKHLSLHGWQLCLPLPVSHRPPNRPVRIVRAQIWCDLICT